MALGSALEGFEYTDLNEVDPSFKPIDADFYNLKILKAELKSFTYKQDSKNHAAGDPGSMLKLQLAVTQHPTYSGRRLFEGLFFGARELRALRKIQDQTGVAQDPGSPFTDWVAKLNERQPVFKAQVTKGPDVDYRGNARSFEADGTTPAVVNKVNWKEILPADNE